MSVRCHEGKEMRVSVLPCPLGATLESLGAVWQLWLLGQGVVGSGWGDDGGESQVTHDLVGMSLGEMLAGVLRPCDQSSDDGEAASSTPGYLCCWSSAPILSSTPSFLELLVLCICTFQGPLWCTVITGGPVVCLCTGQYVWCDLSWANILLSGSCGRKD